MRVADGFGHGAHAIGFSAVSLRALAARVHVGTLSERLIMGELAVPAGSRSFSRAKLKRGLRWRDLAA